jgi:ArsR family transcriptional regulator
MAIDVLAGRVDVLKALAEPVRWRIVERLGDEELCVCHLVEDLGLSQPLVSHHLKVLRDAGIVEPERFKQWIYYRVRPDVLAGLGHELCELADAAPPISQRRRPCC